MQSIVVLSTTAAKYMSVTADFKEVIWFLVFLDDLCIFQEFVDIHCDIQVLFSWQRIEYII